MEIFFADDSAQRTCSRGDMGPLISVGGILIDEQAIQPLAVALDGIAASFGLPRGEEFKWSPNRGSWIRENLHERRMDCYRELLETAATHRAKAIVICNDTARTGDDPGRAFERCLDYLFERLSMNLEDRGAYALMVADRPGGGKRQEDNFLAYFLKRVREGTEYVLPTRILLNVLTTPSDMVRHLQLADVVTGITTAVVAGFDTYAAPLFPYVKRLLITNRPGGVAGTGLKIVPDSPRANTLVNLYRWVLDEKLLHKGGGARAYVLPVAEFPFYKNGRTLE
jgi:hypothetical protein